MPISLQARGHICEIQLYVGNPVFRRPLLYVCPFITVPVFNCPGTDVSEAAAVQHLKRCYVMNWAPQTAWWIWFQSRLGIPLRGWKLSEIPPAPFLSFIVQNQTDLLSYRKTALSNTPVGFFFFLGCRYTNRGLPSQNCELESNKPYFKSLQPVRSEFT